MGPSISESSENFPSVKKLLAGSKFDLLPLFTGKYLFAARDCTGETHVRLRSQEGWHARRPVWRPPIRGKKVPRFLPVPS